MPNVLRFVLDSARDLYVPGAGAFLDGVLDVDANNITAIARARYLVQPYRAVELGIFDSATPKPNLPAPPSSVTPIADPYPLYLTEPEGDARYALKGQGGGGGGAPATTSASDLTSGTLDPARIANDSLPFAKMTGQVSDSQIPAGIARDSEIPANTVMLYDGNLTAARPSVTGPVVWFWPEDPVNSDDTKDHWVQVGDGTGGPATFTAAQITDLVESVQDIVGAFLKAGTNTTVTYDDVANTFTINAAASGGGTTDPEIVRDTIGGALVPGSGIQITVNDAGDTITIASTAVLPTRQVIAGTGLTGGGDLSADRTFAVSYGTAAGTAAQGNDSRLSNARTPTAHASTHASGGSDVITPAAIGAASATITANTQTGTTYTLVAADAGKAVEMNNAAANTLTVPASVFTAGQVVEVLQLGAGQTTVTAGSGLTLRAPDGAKIAKQYGSASLRFRSATEAVLAGNTAT